MDAETTSHTTFMGCVSATGVPAGHLLIFQGKRPFSNYTAQWRECPFAMEASGYMNREIFFSWAKAWELETRPADPNEPRCLFLDNHYSHFAVDVMSYLRACNVRVVALHPHTTHLLCALDCGIFRSFKQHFLTAMHSLTHVAKVADVSGLVKVAWEKAMVKTVNPVTKVEDSVAIRAWARVGLWPFNRNVIDDGEFGYTELYKRENPGEAGQKRARLSLSAEELAKRKQDIVNDYKNLPADVAAVVKRAPRTQMAEIYTYSGTLLVEGEKSEAREAEAQRTAELPWNKEGISRKVYTARKRAEKAKAAEETKAEKAAKKLQAAVVAAPAALEAAAGQAAAAAAKPKAAAKAGKKVRVAQAAPLPLPAPPMVMAAAAQRLPGKRGIKRPRAAGE